MRQKLFRFPKKVRARLLGEGWDTVAADTQVMPRKYFDPDADYANIYAQDARQTRDGIKVHRNDWPYSPIYPEA